MVLERSIYIVKINIKQSLLHEDVKLFSLRREKTIFFFLNIAYIYKIVDNIIVLTLI